MIVLYSSSYALSDLRLDQLRHKISIELPSVDVVGLHATYVYLIDAHGLTSSDLHAIKSLLSVRDSCESDVKSTATSKTLFVTPNKGTITPWSSKATDIARICGLKVTRIERATMFKIDFSSDVSRVDWSFINHLISDRMTHTVVDHIELVDSAPSPRPLRTFDIASLTPLESTAALKTACFDLNITLSTEEMGALVRNYLANNTSPTDAELFMYAQVNSEHCRHKTFNAEWTMKGETQSKTLFAMIKQTHTSNPSSNVLSAYKDNAAVLGGFTEFIRASRFVAACGGTYIMTHDQIHTVAKVFYGITRISDERLRRIITRQQSVRLKALQLDLVVRLEMKDQSAKPVAGLCGYMVSDLNIPGLKQPWETVKISHPSHISSPLDIMLKAPIGSAAFNNEFGRPCVSGFFRTFLAPGKISDTYLGYHKPIMIAGGVGTVRLRDVNKQVIRPGSHLIVLGGPSMLIGLGDIRLKLSYVQGGGSTSSSTSGSHTTNIDYASVQRSNPEMQRRCQQVINACVNEAVNPIVSIHDVGAGGLSNAIPEIVNDSLLGASIDLRAVLCDDASMSPMEIWCNESQERYVLAIGDDASLTVFKSICKRERCPFAVVGVSTQVRQLVVYDSMFGSKSVDMPMQVLFDEKHQQQRTDKPVNVLFESFIESKDSLSEVAKRVLQLPCVGSKAFLITIGDRSVAGLVARDQMVGPWQVPVADVSVVCLDYQSYHGQAMCCGERPLLSIISPSASARMSVAESLTNLAAASCGPLSEICLSANWMSAVSVDGEGCKLYEAVQSIGAICTELGIVIPVGKDSLSMQTEWRSEDGHDINVVSPLTVVVTAYGQVEDIRSTLTPEIGSQLDNETILLFLDLSNGYQRLGGSALAQVYNQIGNDAPDVVDVALFSSFWDYLDTHRAHILAYHDRSDGGLLTTISEMAFAGRTGLSIDLHVENLLAYLFNEELGAVIEIREADLALFIQGHAFSANVYDIGRVVKRELSNRRITISNKGQECFSEDGALLQQVWSTTSYHMQKLRDTPSCADQEHEAIIREDPGLRESLTFMIPKCVRSDDRPCVAVLRDQGVNGHVELAYAFQQAGFKAIDVHMTDIIDRSMTLEGFAGLACPGGFSYGDVLGAGVGWAKTILMNSKARGVFQSFFERENTFTLGICNGCQMLSSIAELIPSASRWPTFGRNKSEQFESRICMVKIKESPSLFLTGMAGSVLPCIVAHGEGLVQCADNHSPGLACISFVKNNGCVAGEDGYPFNPNGSTDGETGFTSEDGRVLIMMPHPERLVRRLTNTWMHRSNVRETFGPWMKIFINAREWVESM